jgi:hypothetical protein
MVTDFSPHTTGAGGETETAGTGYTVTGIITGVPAHPLIETLAV